MVKKCQKNGFLIFDKNALFIKSNKNFNKRARVIQKKFFGPYAGGEEEGFLAFFWPKFTKNVTGEEG
jgi:hypothetical protein